MKAFPEGEFVLLRPENVFLWIVRPIMEEMGTVLLYAPDGIYFSLSFKLDFLYFDEEAKYEALVTGLISALQIGIHMLRVQKILGSSPSKSRESLH